jgi:hypothetical protein
LIVDRQTQEDEMAKRVKITKAQAKLIDDAAKKIRAYGASKEKLPEQNPEPRRTPLEALSPDVHYTTE